MTDAPALRGYDPRASLDQADPDYRYGWIKGSMTTIMEDLKWTEAKWESAKTSLHAAKLRLLVERTPEAAEAFESALTKQRDAMTKLSSMLRLVQDTLDRVTAGEAEQRRRFETYTGRIVEDARRKLGVGTDTPKFLRNETASG